MRELVSEAIAEFSGWDGRFVTSVRALVLKPGLLTLEFLQGRRARYLSPLRLYLFASVAYFVVAAAAPNVRVAGLDDGSLKLVRSKDSLTRSRPERVAEAAREAVEDPDQLTDAKRDSALKDLERAPAPMRPALRQLVTDPKGFKHKIAQTMPKLLFVLLPIFAFIVSIFYRKRRYPEHLYFAIHLHTFLFVALTVIALSKFARGVLPIVLVPIAFAGLLSIPVYATIAFRRVYGGTLAGTLVKEIGIGFIYFVLSVTAMLGLVYWVSIF
ncbi:MAG: DUF3667 domain-containing protein [Gemmatimonadaceae bacterium]|nr:DUF3667 domain-containing protein [Gemmatimonadaceae bacterium]